MFIIENKDGKILVTSGEFVDRSKVTLENLYITSVPDHSLYPADITFREIDIPFTGFLPGRYRVYRGNMVLVYDSDTKVIYFEEEPIEPWLEYFRFWSPLEEDFRRHMKRFGKDFGKVEIKKEGS